MPPTSDFDNWMDYNAVNQVVEVREVQKLTT